VSPPNDGCGIRLNAMSFLHKVGKAAMDALGKASRLADKVSRREDDFSAAPLPEQNSSPFEAPEEEDDEPLANPELPAQVFGRGTDPWTGRSLQLLTDHEVDHEFTDLDGDGGLTTETMLVRETQAQNPPYIFLRGAFIGAYDALNEIVRLGQIEEMTKHPDERDKSGSRTRIVIAKRDGEEPRPGEIGNPDDRK
jgi:glutaredoxin